MQLQSQMEELRRRGVSLVVISADPAEESRAMVAALGLGFPVLVDEQLVAIKAWGVADEPNEIAWPATFLVDEAGVVRWRSLARTYKERPTVAEVLEAVVGLGLGAPAR